MSGVGSDHYGDDFGPKFQEHILAVVARVPSFALRYRTVLHPDFFISKDHRLLARVLLDHVDEFNGLPTEATLVEDIRPRANKGELEALESLVGKLYQQDIGDADAVMAKVIEFGQNQAMVNAVIAGAEKLEQGDRNIRHLIDDALLVGQDLLDLGHDYAGDLESRVSWYLNPEEQIRRLVASGITHMDLAMGGGLGRGEMGVILAPPKRGKTTLLINIGFGALMDPRGLTAVHFTFEMSRDKVARRYDDRLMGKEVRTRSSDPERYTELLRERVETLVRGRLFIKEYPTRTATVSDMRSYLSILQAQGVTPDLVIVDYADIVKAGRRIGEMRHEQAGIYEDLRALAGEFDVALWAGSQSNRGSLDKEVITIQDFAEAFEKAAIVDAAWAFCQTLDEKIDHECRLFGAALRGHEDGLTAVCHIDREACLIESRELLDAAYAKVDRDPAKATDEVPPVIKGAASDAALKDRMGLTTKKKKKRVRKKDSSPSGSAPKRSSGPSRIIEWEDDES